MRTVVLAAIACAASCRAAEAPPALPSLAVSSLPEEGRLTRFRPAFAKHVTVFGVEVVATEETEDRKVLHAANVLAQYLDNDEDGTPDNPEILAVLHELGAFLAMTQTERDFHELDLDWEGLEVAGFELGQDLYGEETLPDGPPHVFAPGRFDAALEEVLHLVSFGYALAYPAVFGFGPDSALADAMDLARGGRFEGVPARYPEEAWYHYDDRTCDYFCQAAEYFYWALTSLLGGQDYPGRAEEIAVEWELPTPALLREGDPTVFALLTDPRYRLPTVLPDGSYGVDSGDIAVP